jgi:hypothetical protein
MDDMIKVKILFFNNSLEFKIVINKRNSVEILKNVIEKIIIKKNNSILNTNIKIIFKYKILKNG